MKRMLSITLGFLMVVGVLTAKTTFADDSHKHGNRRYAVTITNITRGQVITPPVIISHNNHFKLFALGAPAIPELVALAEDGPTGSLLGLLATLPEVHDFVASAGPLLPGTSVTLEVEASRFARYISAVGMLATTNDTFFGIRGIPVPKKKHGARTVTATAYDAGSEGNNESCDFIPGPPCGNAEVRNTATSEGFVSVSSGIHGVGDLDPATTDWRNPVAEIAIYRID